MKGIGLPRRKDPTESVRSIRRTDQPGPRFNYELFNGNNFNIRYWSWNYRGCWHVVGRSFFCRYRHFRFVPAKRGLQPEGRHPSRGVAASDFRPLRNIPTAASRRSLGRVSVPVWPVALSGRLPVDALVGHYPTNKLIGREPIPNRQNFQPQVMKPKMISGIRPRFRGLSRS